MSNQKSIPSRRIAFSTGGLLAGALLVAAGFVGGSRIQAAGAPVDLGTAASFAVLGGTTVTNTGSSTISGDVGVSPGSAVTGFPPGTVINGTIHKADAVAAQAQSNLTTAYNVAAGETPTSTGLASLNGLTLVPGVYAGGALGLPVGGTLTLNGEGQTNAQFVFQASSTLIMGSASHVVLINGAQACNVFWQVGSSATLGTSSVFVGNIMALTSVSAKTGAVVKGRLLARNGEVSLESNAITSPTCTSTKTSTSGTTTSGTTTSGTTTSGTTTSGTTTSGTTTSGTTTSGTTTSGTTTSGTTTSGTTTSGTTTSGTTSTGTSATVPIAATGEPWAGWPYWVVISLAGVLGVGSMAWARRHRLTSHRKS